MANYLFTFYNSYGITVVWITVFSSAYKLFTNNWCPCVLVCMISSDATIYLLQIHQPHSWSSLWSCRYTREITCEVMWDKVNNVVDLVVDWLFQLHHSTKPSFQVGVIKVWKLVAWEGPTVNIFQWITVEFCNRETFPANYSWVLQPRNFSTSNNLQYTVLFSFLHLLVWNL